MDPYPTTEHPPSRKPDNKPQNTTTIVKDNSPDDRSTLQRTLISSLLSWKPSLGAQCPNDTTPPIQQQPPITNESKTTESLPANKPPGVCDGCSGTLRRNILRGHELYCCPNPYQCTKPAQIHYLTCCTKSHLCPKPIRAPK